METIEIRTGVPYSVYLGSGLLAHLGTLAKQLPGVETVMIVSDDRVFDLYGQTASESLSSSGFTVRSFVFPHGEAHKNLETYASLIGAMSAASMNRNDLVAALGGGVVGDLAGFAAATYERGIRFVQVPTTNLAAVDASVGGKTGIDFGAEKNRIGAFYQPSFVLTDPDTFQTLPEDVYLSGVAETLKTGMIASEALFSACMKTPVNEQYVPVIKASVSVKRDFVEADEFDRGRRMLLNFGHTFGHAIEAESGYQLMHGFAVASGMAIVTRAAAEKGYCEKETLRRLTEALHFYHLPQSSPYPADALIPHILNDKKRKGNEIRLVVPRSVGQAETVSVKADEIREWLNAGGVL